ncbi:PLHD1 protein [Octopus vulgaris]|uniref:PLHD1 protein n=1 Tax=Octopus vulgaris TaxID=6645 RepID=A0AA36AZ17_OCTVU|nr:PLHD1 protein [Octopus vulgaris]
MAKRNHEANFPPLALVKAKEAESKAVPREHDRMMALSKEERIPDRMMDLPKEERIELVLLSGRERWSYRKIAEFNLRHPCRQPIFFTAVGKLIKKFKETGSVLDKPRSGRPKTSDETKEAVMAKFSASPKKSLRRTSTVLGVPKPTIHKMLVEEKFHRYNLQILHHLNEDDPDRRM